MIKLLVLYHSNGGNTKQIAEHVTQGIQQAAATDNQECEVRLRNTEQATADDLLWCDGIALGSPTNYGNMSWQLKQWWDQTALPLWSKIDGKVGCVFSASGGDASGGEMCCLSMLSLLINFGFLVFGVTDYVAPKKTLHYGTIIPGEPRSQAEIASCTLLGEKLYRWTLQNTAGQD